MSELRDLTGQKFGRLTVITRAESDKRGSARWFCHCDCDNETTVMSYRLISGRTQSCGCMQKELTSKRFTTHGKANTRIYGIWTAMKKRCESPYDSSYESYGGRGIKVCEEWHEFESFHRWAITNGYADNLSIDRKNTNGNYEPSNCRWVNNKIQANNKSNNHMLTFKGKTQTMAMWCDDLGIPRQRLENRIRRGWSTQRALTTV
ncbi:MAG: hypothetical protein M0T74_13750 [Desulfitobacterium hafniense]|nr:hypothetical protein [Desulfitobacterium hafniense]